MDLNLSLTQVPEDGSQVLYMISSSMQRVVITDVTAKIQYHAPP